MIESLNVPGGNTVALQTDVLVTTRDGCTLSITYDPSTYNSAKESYQITSVTAHNPTGTNGFPAREITVWAIYKGNYVSEAVPAGTDQTWTPTGNRTTADVTGVGIS